METTKNAAITIKTVVKSSVEKVWQYWNEPQHITQWCTASEDWHTPKAENDLREGGKITSTMAAKDGSMSFEFGGVYTKVEQHKQIAYTMGDGRKVNILFSANGNETAIEETFDPEQENSIEMQRAGWQAILDNFKKYTESH